MIKAVLLDLDDTLLGNPTQRFVENYIGALDQFIRERLGLSDISRPLLAGIRQVVRNLDPTRTNQEIFFETFEPLLTVERAAFDQAVAEFYHTAYLGLRAGTAVRTWARPLVERLAAQGYQVVVATNPFFPRIAIEHRMDWAGVGDFPFNWVTTLENMHFSKPNPHYYEEILARIGVPACEALMVGDDWQNDIVPAWRAGLNTYWIGADDAPGLPDPAVHPDGYGSPDDFARLVLDDGWLDTLTPRPLSPDQIAPRLLGTLAALLGVARAVPASCWNQHPAAGEWSPAEVICHLFATEQVMQRPRLEMIVHADDPLLESRSGLLLDTCPADGWPLALDFAAERLLTLEFFAGLDASAWNRPARHPRLGPTTLLGLADLIAGHDRIHIHQLLQTIQQCV